MAAIARPAAPRAIGIRGCPNFFRTSSGLHSGTRGKIGLSQIRSRRRKLRAPPSRKGRRSNLPLSRPIGRLSHSQFAPLPPRPPLVLAPARRSITESISSLRAGRPTPCRFDRSLVGGTKSSGHRHQGQPLDYHARVCLKHQSRPPGFRSHHPLRHRR
jgi:hypothetical protein